MQQIEIFTSHEFKALQTVVNAFCLDLHDKKIKGVAIQFAPVFQGMTTATQFYCWVTYDLA